MSIDLAKAAEKAKAARPRLGNNIPITLYRQIIYNTLSEVFGTDAQAAIIYNAGRRLGLRTNIKNTQDLANYVKENLMGILKVGKIEPENVSVVLEESATCAGIEPVGRPICFFEAGFLGGAIQNIIGKKIMIKEVKCWGLGDKYCEFTLRQLE